MASVISGDANVSATEFGYLDGVTSALQTQMDAKLPIAGGKILQIVRATDSTNRSTTSTSFVDAGISVTITPQKSDSAVLIAYLALVRHSGASDFTLIRIADNSNNAIAGTANTFIGSNSTGDFYTPIIIIAYATPATTSATTYKVRYSVFSSGTATLSNATQIGQLYAIEVSA